MTDPTQADQVRMETSVHRLEDTATMTRVALPLAPVIWGVLGFAADLAIGAATGDGDGEGKSTGPKGKGGVFGLVKEVVRFIRDGLASVLGGVAGAVMADRLASGFDEDEAHEEQVEAADDALEWGDELLARIQARCADSVEGCANEAVAAAQVLLAMAGGSPEPQATQARTAAGNLIAAAGTTVCTLLEERNTAMSECMDFMVGQCAPAAEEGNCRTPLVKEPAPAVVAADCGTEDVPDVSDAVVTSPAAACPPPAQGMVQEAPTAPTASSTAGVAAAGSAAGVVTQAASLAGVIGSVVPPLPPGPQISMPVSVDVGAMIQNTGRVVGGFVNDVVTEVTTALDIGLCDIPAEESPPGECPPPDCPPEEPPVVEEQGVEEPVVEEVVDDECPEEELEGGPGPEVIPVAVDPVEGFDKSGFDKSGFDKSGYMPDEVQAGESAQEPPVDTSAVPDDEPTANEPLPADLSWSPDVWVTDAESAPSADAAVERSGDW